MKRRNAHTVKGSFAVQFAACSSNEKGRERFWRIDVTDELSRVHVLTIDFSLEQFACALSATYVDGVRGKLTVSPHHGKRHEFRSEEVTLPDDVKLYDKAAFARFMGELAKRFAAEGWELDRDRGNPHRRTSGNGYTVHLRRWVEVDGEDSDGRTEDR